MNVPALTVKQCFYSFYLFFSVLQQKLTSISPRNVRALYNQIQKVSIFCFVTISRNKTNGICKTRPSESYITQHYKSNTETKTRS